MLDNLTDLFKLNQKQLLVYMGVETILDPYNKNISIAYINPLTVNSIVSDLTFTKMQYAMPGVRGSKAKEIVIEKRYRQTLEISHKLRVNGEDDYYEGWRVNGRMQWREEGNYLRLYIYSATTDTN